MEAERPKQLIPERYWLLDLLSRTYTGPQSTTTDWDRWNSLGAELAQNYNKIVQELTKLVEKLPQCEDCPLTATYWVKNGPFFCDIHAREHSSAVEVPWAGELRTLGTDPRA